MNQSINQIPILMAIAALVAAIFAPTASATVEPPAFSFAFGKFGEGGEGKFLLPRALAIDSKSNVWVVDWPGNRIQKFNSEGIYQSQFGTKGTGNGQLKKPSDIAIDSSGNLWVVDTENHRVQKFSSEGKYLSQFGIQGSGNGQLTIRKASQST